MPNIFDAYPKTYLSAGDLLDTKPTVTIAKVKFGDIGHGAQQQRKPLVTLVARETTFPHGETLTAGEREQILRALEKQWPLNITNAKAIARLFGTDDYDRWAGQRLELFPTRVDFKGDLVDTIRCGAPPKVIKKKNDSSPPDDTNDNGDDDGGIPF